MRSLVLVTLVLALAAPAAAARAKPALRIVGTTPLTVRGTAFRAHERVRVTVSGRATRIVLASRTGTFTVAFAGVDFDRCADGWTIVADGSRGSAALLKLPQLECPPSLGP